MKLFPFGRDRLAKGAHAYRDLRRRWGQVSAAGDEDGHASITSSLLLVDAPVEEPVQLQDVTLGEFALAGQREHEIVSVSVPDRFQVILERLTTNGQSVLDNDLRFCLCQAVAFQRVACVGQADLEVVFERRDVLWPEWAQLIKLGFKGVELLLILGFQG